MDKREKMKTEQAIERYKKMNPLPHEKQDEAMYDEIIQHVLKRTDDLTEDEIRAVVATSCYMYLVPADKRAFIGVIANSYDVTEREIVEWDKAINTSLEEPSPEKKTIPFDVEEVLLYSRTVMSHYGVLIEEEAQHLLRHFFEAFPKTIKRNVNYRSIVGAVEYAVIVTNHPELKEFDQQTLANKYEVSRTSLAVWYKNIKKYCGQEAVL